MPVVRGALVVVVVELAELAAVAVAPVRAPAAGAARLAAAGQGAALRVTAAISPTQRTQ